MDNVSIKMKNCFGIKKLNRTFDFSIRNVFTVYAINGTMKSSFARAFKCFQDGKIEEIKDKIYDIQGEFELKFDSNDANREQVFVINSFDDKYEIIGRMYAPIKEQNQHDFVEFLLGIDEEMPKHYRKGKDFILKYLSLIRSDELDMDFDINMQTLNKGNVIYYRNEFWTIIGKNDKKEQWCNGMNIQNMPFFNYTENYSKKYI